MRERIRNETYRLQELIGIQEPRKRQSVEIPVKKKMELKVEPSMMIHGALLRDTS
jgi:hypothetical protein